MANSKRLDQHSAPPTTRIVITTVPEIEALHPFCNWPPSFESSLELLRRTILSVETWDGSRRLLSVAAPDSSEAAEYYS